MVPSFLWTLIFRAVLASQQNFREGRDISYVPLVLMHAQPPFPTIGILPQSWTFIRIDEPPRTQHFHPKSTVDIRAHSYCCVICAFGHMHNVVRPPLHHPTDQSHCPNQFPYGTFCKLSWLGCKGVLSLWTIAYSAKFIFLEVLFFFFTKGRNLWKDE